jgi:hypothetical protein
MGTRIGLCLSVCGCRKTAAFVPPAPPTNTVAPSFSRTDSTLSSSPGTWTGSPIISYQWRRNGVAISGATDPNYTIPAESLGALFSLDVTGTNAGGSLTVSAGQIFVGVLDVVAGASGGYSLRRLRSGYSGPAIRVRRSSDNVESDINFISDGTLDLVGLLAFTGANDGLLVTWYDQVGAVNAVQATTTLQPRLVTAGAVNVSGGKPVVVGDGVNDIMTMGTGFNVDGAFAVNAVARIYSTTGFPRIASKWNNLSVAGDWLLAPATANASRFGVREGTTNKIAAISLALETTALHIHTGTFNTSEVRSWYDRVNTAALTILGAPLPASAATVALFKDTHPSTAPATIGISEAMLFTNDLSSSRATIEANQQATWL